MKRTTTRETKQYAPCGCGGFGNCPLCQGTGRYVSSTSIETIEEYYEDQETQGAIDAEVVTELPCDGFLLVQDERYIQDQNAQDQKSVSN